MIDPINPHTPITCFSPVPHCLAFSIPASPEGKPLVSDAASNPNTNPSPPTTAVVPVHVTPTSLLATLHNLVSTVAILGLLVVVLYDHFRPAPAPLPPVPVVAPEPAVVELGKVYSRTLPVNAVTIFESVATSNPASTGAVTKAMQDAKHAGDAAAWAPVSAELAKRFGPASDTALDATRQAELRKFFLDLATGAKAK